MKACLTIIYYQNLRNLLFTVYEVFVKIVFNFQIWLSVSTIMKIVLNHGTKKCSNTFQKKNTKDKSTAKIIPKPNIRHFNLENGSHKCKRPRS